MTGRPYDQDAPYRELLEAIAENAERREELRARLRRAEEHRDRMLTEAIRRGMDRRELARASRMSWSDVEQRTGGGPRRPVSRGPIMHQLRAEGIELEVHAATKEQAFLAAEEHARLLGELTTVRFPTFVIGIVDPTDGSSIARVSAGLADEGRVVTYLKGVEELLGTGVRALVTPLGSDQRAVPWTWPVIGRRMPSRARPLDLVAPQSRERTSAPRARYR